MPQRLDVEEALVPDNSLVVALQYGRRGLPVLALKPRGKEPLTRRGFLDATTEKTIIQRWWSHWPEANIGIRTGQDSFICLDVDPRNGGSQSLAALEREHGSLPPTVEAQTGGGGRHILFRHPGGEIPCSSGRLGLGLDVKADGGYVVAPPSRHPNGAVYHWREGCSPDDVKLADLPVWLLEAIAGGKDQAQAHALVPTIPLDDLMIPGRMKRLIREGDSEGKYPSRSEAEFGAIRSLVKAGYDDGVIKAVLLNPDFVLAQKPREKGAVWLTEEIRRAREKPDEASKSVRSTNRKRSRRNSTSTPAPVCLADVEPEEVDWLWYPYIPRGKVTSIEGDPGVGKSWLTLVIAAEVSRGGKLLEAPLGEPGHVLILTAEDGLADTVRPRLDALGADAKNVFAIEVPVTMDADGITYLEKQVEELKPGLVILDPLVAYMGEKVSLDKANQTRKVMASLAAVAEKHHCAIVTIRHLSKGTREKAIYRGLGSIDITAACRSVLMVGLDPEDDNRRIIAHAKCNLAQLGPSLSYTIANGRFEWTGEVDVSAEQLCAEPADDEARTALDEAMTFIEQELRDGTVKANDMFKKARDVGISDRTLKRAKKKLGGIRSVKQGAHWVWEWEKTAPPL